MENMDIYNRARQVPDSAKKPIDGGRIKGATSINPQWRIEKLTELFGAVGFGWYYKVIDKRIETQGGETCAFADIELYVKHEGEWSMPIYGTGGSKLVSMENRGVHVNDECFKMAITDALSVACKELGIGADVYWNKGETSGENQKQTWQQAPFTPQPEPKVNKDNIPGYPVRDELIGIVYKYYPKGTEEHKKLLAYWGKDRVEDASTSQLAALYNKYKDGRDTAIRIA